MAERSEVGGNEKIAWRYDPVLLTQKYTIERHAQTFRWLCKKLAPHIDRCIFSFVEIYKKLQVNMPELIPLSESDMNTLAEILGKTAKEFGIRIQTCGTN